MLSRLAESFFWIGRYTERAEATTRLLSEHHQQVVEDTRVPIESSSAALLDALAIDGDPISRPGDLVSAVLGSSADPSTVVGSVAAARENSRAIRDAIPGELFEALNAVHNRLASGVPLSIPGVALKGILDQLALVSGTLDWTLPRDEGYHFLVLGQALERVDMTARLLEIDHSAIWPQAGPAVALRSAAGSHAFQRNRAAMGRHTSRSFLVLDAQFPRSMRHSAVRAEESVRQLERLGTRDGEGRLLRSVGILRSELEFAPEQPGQQELDELILAARRMASEASNAVSEAFFRQAGTIVWSH